MSIRVAERAKIPQEFKDALVTVSVEQLKNIREKLAYMNGYQLGCYKKEMGPAIVRLGKIVKDPAAMDELATRLRGLPYTGFEIIAHGQNANVKFFAGTTREVVIRHAGDKYNLGPFRVCIPFSKIVGTKNRTREKGEDWHFIPLMAAGENTSYRHPHHYGVWGEYSSTCWGSFNSMIVDLCNQADIPELFRTIYIYLTRYDAHSVLHGHIDSGYYNWAEVS